MKYKEIVTMSIINEYNPRQMAEELERVIDIANKRFSIDEILEVWYSVYGEDMAEPKFIDELRQRLS